MVTVIFFASLRERLGCHQEYVELPGDEGTVAELVLLLEARHPEWQGLLTAGNIKIACNQHICELDSRLGPNDEVAFFPPVTGG